MAHPRSIAAQPANPASPVGIGQLLSEVVWVSAVDHEVRRNTARCLVDRGDRLPERLTGRQAPVGLHGERHHDRQAERLGSSNNTDRLVGLSERQRRHHVHVGLGEPSKLLAVVALSLGRDDVLFRCIRVTARADETVDDNRPSVGREPVSEIGCKFDRSPVRVSEFSSGLAESFGEVRLCPPCLCVENEAQPGVASKGEEALHVARECDTTAFVGEQGMCRELRYLDAVIEDQVGLQTGVVEEQASVQLRKMMSVLCHVNQCSLLG